MPSKAEVLFALIRERARLERLITKGEARLEKTEDSFRKTQIGELLFLLKKRRQTVERQLLKVSIGAGGGMQASVATE